MASTAGGKGSIVVNTSSAAMRTTTNPMLVGLGMYAASKAAADMLTKYAAIEVKSRCNHSLAFDTVLSTAHTR